MNSAPQKILIVDDEPQIIRFLTYALQASGYACLAATDGKEALKALKEDTFDAMILDLGLPDMDGKTLIEAVRKDSDLPIIVLSAHDQEMQRIMALDLGADDFIAKPFGIGELLARLRANMRRLKASRLTPSPAVDGFGLDAQAREVTLDGNRIKLTKREFELMELLAQNLGSIVKHRNLLESVWGPAHVEDVAYLRVFIGQLRKKLALTAQSPVQIQTEPSIGYRLVTNRTAVGREDGRSDHP